MKDDRFKSYRKSWHMTSVVPLSTHTNIIADHDESYFLRTNLKRQADVTLANDFEKI